jgi:hypothetical protein
MRAAELKPGHEAAAAQFRKKVHIVLAGFQTLSGLTLVGLNCSS